MIEYKCKYYSRICCHSFDANEYLISLAKELQTIIAGRGVDGLSLSLYGQGDNGDFAEVKASGAGAKAVLIHAMTEERQDLPVILNVSADAPAEMLTSITDDIVVDVSGRFNLSVIMMKKEIAARDDERGY